MFLDDRGIYFNKIADTLAISRERVGYIIYEKHDRVFASEAILDRFIHINIRSRDQRAVQEWRRSGPRVQRSSRQKSSSKVLATVFSDKDCILLVDYLE
jgi:orotate phosphoribosyltransferase-like protein